MIKYTQLLESIQDADESHPIEPGHEFRPEVTPSQRKHYAGVYQDFVKKHDIQAGAFVHASILPKNLRSHLKKYGSASLIGQEAPTTHDLAILAQIHRDPRVESLHMIYTKGNKIVGHNTVSSRMPGLVQPFRYGRNSTTDVLHMQDDMKHFGADGYYMVHNHPSGRSHPSSADITLTKYIAERVPGFKSHVVIDNSEYHTIDKNGDTKHVKLDHPIHYDLHNPEHRLKHHEVIGMSVTSAKDVADVGKHFEDPHNITLFGVRGPHAEVSSVVSMPPHLLGIDEKKSADRIRHFARHTGSTRQFIVVPTDADRWHYKHHIKNGTVTDVVSTESGTGIRSLVAGNDNESSLGIHLKDIKRHGSLTNKEL